MKKLMTMTMVLLLSVLLAVPALAAKPEENAASQAQSQDGGQGKEGKVTQDPHQSDAFKRQQANIKQREEMKARRDAAQKVRERNVESNSPGKTGL